MRKHQVHTYQKKKENTKYTRHVLEKKKQEFKIEKSINLEILAY